MISLPCQASLGFVLQSLQDDHFMLVESIKPNMYMPILHIKRLYANYSNAPYILTK